MTCPACLRARSARISPVRGAGNVTSGIRDEALKKGVKTVWINGRLFEIETEK